MRIENPDQYQGKIIRVYFLEEHAPIVGEYDGFTPEYDDPDNRANISVTPIGEEGWGYDLYEDEIERIEIVECGRIMSFSIEEFRGLSQPEKIRRYKELSKKDKFIARMEDWGYTGESKVAEEEFFANPPKGWEFVTKEMLEDMFPQENKQTE